VRIGRGFVPAVVVAFVVALVASVAALGLSGCVARKAAPSPITVPPPRRLVLTPGEQVRMFDLAFEVRSVQAAQPGVGVPRLAVTIRAQNEGDLPLISPDVVVTCKENRDGGNWSDDSTWESNAILPPGVISEGVINVGFPAKPDAPTYPLMVCTDAEVQVTATRTRDRHQVVATLPVSADVVRAAIDAV